MTDEGTAGTPIVVMGVSGAGKSSIAALLASRLRGVYLDADDFHSPEARAKMAAGIPLSDDDRAPWLERVAQAMVEVARTGPRPVVACSALRRAYRDALRATAGPELTFVLLEGDAALLASRIEARSDHFMPAALLASQLATLEPLEADERGFHIGVRREPDAIVDTVISRL